MEPCIIILHKLDESNVVVAICEQAENLTTSHTGYRESWITIGVVSALKKMTLAKINWTMLLVCAVASCKMLKCANCESEKDYTCNLCTTANHCS